jgi:hypothetical protein
MASYTIAAGEVDVSVKLVTTYSKVTAVVPAASCAGATYSIALPGQYAFVDLSVVNQPVSITVQNIAGGTLTVYTNTGNNNATSSCASSTTLSPVLVTGSSQGVPLLNFLVAPPTISVDCIQHLSFTALLSSSAPVTFSYLICLRSMSKIVCFLLVCCSSVTYLL